MFMISQKVLTNGSTLSFPRLPRLPPPWWGSQAQWSSRAIRREQDQLGICTGQRINELELSPSYAPENSMNTQKWQFGKGNSPLNMAIFGIYVSSLGCIPTRFLVAVWERCTFCSSTQCHHHIQVWPERGKTLLDVKEWAVHPEVAYRIYLTLKFWRATSHCLTWLKARIINSSHV